jgi:hypothetical protein
MILNFTVLFFTINLSKEPKSVADAAANPTTFGSSGTLLSIS